ncbi:hypothetical protein BBK82_32910 [Lentzea guizhouensis]|uniref:Phosphatidic acid phosphatase type 2/haloperoxidase domain-containing protein n=1 Tax=Lentzea guizhouensis TaxID=1586287 RepID=A0A1B2HZT4_9PSEU|nr:hypothetical protein BBK82_32910 [Lentzea guizhouensis]
MAVNELDEDSQRDSEFLPARRPNHLVVAASLTARGGLLWLPVAGIVALTGRKQAAGRALLAAVVAMPLGHLVSLVVHRRRPHSTLPARLALPEHPRSSSFPSKHAMTAAAFGTVIAVEDPPAGAFVTPLVLLVAYSRLRTRVHWPTDVIGGLALGGLVWVVWGVLRRKR